jgi:hypothetical protein
MIKEVLIWKLINWRNVPNEKHCQEMLMVYTAKIWWDYVYASSNSQWQFKGASCKNKQLLGEKREFKDFGWSQR